MIIKILGTGCSKCNKLYKMTQSIVKDFMIEATVERVENYKEILSYGVMSTPALVINEKVEIYGRVPNKSELKQIIIENAI